MITSFFWQYYVILFLFVWLITFLPRFPFIIWNKGLVRVSGPGILVGYGSGFGKLGSGSGQNNRIQIPSEICSHCFFFNIYWPDFLFLSTNLINRFYDVFYQVVSGFSVRAYPVFLEGWIRTRPNSIRIRNSGFGSAVEDCSNFHVSSNWHSLYFACQMHGTHIRWWLRTCCARIKENRSIWSKKSDSWLPPILSNALNRSNNKDCSLCAHLFLSYHRIYMQPCSNACTNSNPEFSWRAF